MLFLGGRDDGCDGEDDSGDCMEDDQAPPCVIAESKIIGCSPFVGRNQLFMRPAAPTSITTTSSLLLLTIVLHWNQIDYVVSYCR